MPLIKLGVTESQMKGQTLRYIIAILSLLLLLGSCAYAQDEPKTELQTQFATLQKDSEEIPGQFDELIGRLKLSNWNPTCHPEGKTVAEKSFKSFTNSLKEATYLAGTLRASKGVPLPEVAEVAYTFSIGVPINMVLYKTAICTGQQDVADDFMALSLHLVDAANNAHKVEMQLIQAEENIILNMDKRLKELEKSPSPPKLAIPPEVDHAVV
jgi:hypothetical protein